MEFILNLGVALPAGIAMIGAILIIAFFAYILVSCLLAAFVVIL